jgi:uncharacterized membrane protein
MTKRIPAKHGSAPVKNGGRISVTHDYKGPIPPPDQLAAFNQIIPDGANRIMILAEKSLDFEISRQEKILATRNKAIACEHTEVVLGQVFSFLICLGVLGGGIALVWHNYPISGTILSGISLTSVVATLVTRGKKS